MKITVTTLTSSPKGLRRGNETILETYIASGKQQVKTLRHEGWSDRDKI